MSAPLELLLLVQERDVALDRIAHRRATLPELKERVGARASVAELDREIATLQAEADELGSRQARLEAEAEAAGARAQAIERRLYGGEVSASRELSAMAEEAASLARRRSELEDEALALLVEMEPVGARISELAARRAELAARIAELDETIAAKDAELAGEEAAEAAARAELAAGLPAELAERYEQLRHRLGGVGAARLENGVCTGCHLALSATERERVHRLPPGSVLTCEQCGRILVP